MTDWFGLSSARRAQIIAALDRSGPQQKRKARIRGLFSFRRAASIPLRIDPANFRTRLASMRAPLRHPEARKVEIIVAVDAHGEWAAGLAKQLIATGKPPPSDLDDAQRLALAWALKDCAIAAWNTAPSEVVVASDLLIGMAAATDGASTVTSIVEIHAISEWVAGVAELTRGKMSLAISHLDRASRLFRTGGKADHAAHAQIPKIMALSMLGQPSQAAESGRQTMRELVNTGNLLAAGKVCQNLGVLHYRQTDHGQALSSYRDAIKFFSAVDAHENVIACDMNIADVQASLGNFGEAMRTYADAALRTQQHNFPVLQALIEESVALVHLARGNYRSALNGLETCRGLYEQLGLPQQLATAEKQLADAYLEVRLLPEALALFDRSLRRFESLEMPVEQAWALAQRGRGLAALGCPSGEIAACLRQASDLFNAQGISAGHASVLHAQAELALGQNAPKVAIGLARDAAALFAESGLVLGRTQSEILCAHALLQNAQVDAAAELFTVTLSTSSELQLLSIAVRCQVGLGLVAKARGELDSARAAFESAIALSEEQRAALPGDDIRGAFLMDQLRPYEEILRIALEAFDTAPCIDAATNVIVQLERFRARALGDRLGEPKTHIAATGIDDPDADRRAHLSWLYRRRQKLIDEGDDPQALTEETRRVEHELLELARRRRLTADINPLSTEVRAFDPALLKAALLDGEAVVEYGVMDDELFACVITPNKIALTRRVARWSAVLEAIHAARFQIDTLRHGAGAVDRHIEQLTRRSVAAMRRLHELVWAPLTSLLTGCRRVLVVPHDQLGSVQFAALHDGEKYLAQTLEIAMAPSASIALYGLTRKPVSARRAVVLGESSRLVHATDEAKFVAGLFDEATVLTGEAADAGSLRTACADADVLHLACHAEFRSDNPMFSALQLVDGPFTVQDAETLPLRQGIVVLSACETGVAAYSRGDEMIGLVRAFLVAGASRVVASLWPVDDAVTMQLMAAFYRSLRAGNSPAHALRVAQLDVMQAHPHPFHWAAFTLYGGW